MLEVKNINAAYAGGQVLFDFNLRVRAGSVTALLGRNGMGKTTAVNCIMGIVRATGGEILWQDQPLRALPSFQIARRGIALAPEGRRIFANLTARENLLAAARGGDWTLDKVLAFFPALSARLHHLGGKLSGGEQQMLSIGRALMQNPALLILDEATEGLAPLVREEIWRRLQQLKQTDLSILIIDKNIDALSRLADQLCIIEKGRNVWQGDGETLRADAALQTRHLGV